MGTNYYIGLKCPYFIIYLIYSFCYRHAATQLLCNHNDNDIFINIFLGSCLVTQPLCHHTTTLAWWRRWKKSWEMTTKDRNVTTTSPRHRHSAEKNPRWLQRTEISNFYILACFILFLLILSSANKEFQHAQSYSIKEIRECTKNYKQVLYLSKIGLSSLLLSVA